MASNIYYQHIMEVLETNEEVKDAFQGISHQMAYAAGGAVIGGILDGRQGGLVGSLVGGIVGYLTGEDYNSMLNILRKMPAAERERLVTSVQHAVGSATIEALNTFLLNTQNMITLIGIVKKFAYK